MKLIQVYAPIPTHEEEEIDKFYDEITTPMEDKNIKTTIIMGDFKAKIVKKIEDSQNKIGNYGFDLTLKY